MHVGAAALGCSDDAVFGLALWFFDAGPEFADQLCGGVAGGRASAFAGGLHNGRARSWAVCLWHLLLITYGDKVEKAGDGSPFERRITCGRV